MQTRGSYSRGRWWMFALVLIGLVGWWSPPAAMAQDDPASETTIDDDATVASLFVDFLHYARLGRFTMADAYAQALLRHPDLDPVEVLDLASRDAKAVQTLMIIIENSSIGENAARVLDLIEQGEIEKRKSPDRIQANIKMLAGDPQQEYRAIRHLAESGEYAIPFIIATLLDPERQDIAPRVISALPKIGKGAVTPLTTALSMRDDAVRLNLIHALGELGYPHALPHLRKVIADADMPGEMKAAATQAIQRIEQFNGRAFPGSPDELFFRLAEKYYNEDASVRADPRLDTANVWYWDDTTQALTATVVARPIFGPVMAMRCCEEALRLRDDNAQAIALWLSANIRRESRLGMNVESGDPDETGDPDATRPSVFPRSLYFTVAAGPRYAHLVLERAVAGHDAAVALGAIEALRITAGESSLVGTEDYKQPLVEALRFPDLLVRIRAALALGAALPRTAFADSQFVTPVLAEAVTLTGREQVLVVDGDESNLNRVMNVMRQGGRDVIGDTNFYRALERARIEFHGLTALFVSAGIREPAIGHALSQFRGEFTYARTPVLLLSGPQDELLARKLASGDPCLESVNADADGVALEAALERVRSQSGQAPLDTRLASSLALQATRTLRSIAVDGRTVFDLGVAEPSLIAALSSDDEELQIAAASVLARVRTAGAQRSIARIVLDAGEADSLRVALFHSLAESAKRNGNLLEERTLAELVDIARNEPDLTIRTAAGEALGALNLATSKASEIIRSYYGG